MPRVSSLGTVGQSDLAQNADLAHGALGALELEAGEALALLNGNAFSTGQAALAVADAALVDRVVRRGCRARLRGVPRQCRRAPPGDRRAPVRSAGVGETLTRLNALLDRERAPERRRCPLPPGPAQLPLRPAGARCRARRARLHGRASSLVELNAHQGNPLIVSDEARLVSVGNFDSQALATALDLARLALAPVVTAAVERTLKLLSPRFSGLTEGLVAAEGSWQDGLSELGVAAQAITAEARLLAQPVSLELASTMQESGVEDRTSLSSLGARRLDEMLGLAARVVAIELTVAAQAVDLRGPLVLGAGAAAIHDYVRERVDFLDAPERMPLPLEELASTIRTSPPPA